MKGCIVLQRQWALIGNAIALELKNRYGIREFCGYIMLRRTQYFVNLQKDINYANLIVDEDVHNQYKQEKLDIEYLKKIETEYGTPNLWPYLAVDRTLMMNIPPREYSISPTPPYTHEEMLRIIQVTFKNITKFLEKEKPDFLIMPLVGTVGTMAIYNIAKKMGIKTLTTDIGRIKNLVTFTENYKTLTGVEEIFKNIKENNYKSPYQQKALSLLEEFRKTPVPPSYAIKKKDKSLIEKILSAPTNLLRSVTFIIRSTTNYLKNPYKSEQTTENPWYTLIDKIIRKIRSLRNLNKLYDKPNWNEDFVYFPLHWEPEINTLLLAPFFTNQINLLTQIAKSLPAHFKLYVKEHPGMSDYRPTEYYKELKKIPNLKFINTATSSFDLIKNSKLIITITGTAGWEACLLKKPVITFGEVFFNTLSFVKKCRAIEDLPYIVKQQLENFQYDEREIVNMLSAILEDTVSFDYDDLWIKGDYEQIKNDHNFPKFVDALAKKIGLSIKK